MVAIASRGVAARGMSADRTFAGAVSTRRTIRAGEGGVKLQTLDVVVAFCSRAQHVVVSRFPRRVRVHPHRRGPGQQAAATFPPTRRHLSASCPRRPNRTRVRFVAVMADTRGRGRQVEGATARASASTMIAKDVAPGS